VLNRSPFVDNGEDVIACGNCSFFGTQEREDEAQSHSLSTLAFQLTLRCASIELVLRSSVYLQLKLRGIKAWRSRNVRQQLVTIILSTRRFRTGLCCELCFIMKRANDRRRGGGCLTISLLVGALVGGK